jgi:hypothetical protein
MDWRRLAAPNKQAAEIPKEFRPAVKFLLNEALRYSVSPDVQHVRLGLPTSLRGQERLHFLEQLRPVAAKAMAQAGIQGWTINPDTLAANDLYPNDMGYVNTAHLIKHPFKIGMLLERAATEAKATDNVLDFVAAQQANVEPTYNEEFARAS